MNHHCNSYSSTIAQKWQIAACKCILVMLSHCEAANMINFMSQTVRKMQQINIKIAIYGQFRWLKVTKVKSEVIAFLIVMWASSVLSFVANAQSIVPFHAFIVK